jgi:hypothetical protein
MDVHLYSFNAQRMKVALVVFFCFWTFNGLHAQTQKQTEQVEQIWIGCFNQTRFSKRWGAWLDVQLRTKDHFTDSLSQFLLRPGVTYYIDDKTKLTLGYAFINHFPADSHPDISQPEHRIWQQVQWHTNYKKLRTMQWFRLEERFRRKIKDADELAEGYNFNFRIRYNFLIQGPLTRKLYDKGALNWVFNDELHINFGKEIVYNYFDQNRLFLGFNYYLTKHNTLQFGYMNLFQQLSAGNKYKMIHTARVFFFHNLNL